MAQLVSPEQLRDLIDYNPASGRMTWRVRPECLFRTPGEARRWNGLYAGKPAGTAIDGQGYLQIKIFSRCYLSHRVAWAVHYGAWPQIIDHKNHVKSDNRLRNLRSVSRLVAQRNQSQHRSNSSGFTGVAFHRKTGKWMAFIKDRGSQVNLGYFDQIEDAVAARRAAERRLGYRGGQPRPDKLN
jgi:hypothetical protein